MTQDNFDLEKGGVKFDAGKIRMDLVPMDAVMAEAAVYTYGAIKYDDWNWAKGMRKGRIMAALLRHAAAYLLGEDNDPESGLPHSWHMRCCTGMLVAGELRAVAVDDRKEAMDAYRKVHDIFAGMKDPAGTVKNGGGSIVEPRRMSANEWRYLDGVHLPKKLRLVSNPVSLNDERVGTVYDTYDVVEGGWTDAIFEEVID